MGSLRRITMGYAAAYSLLIFFILLGYSYVTQRIGKQESEAAA